MIRRIPDAPPLTEHIKKHSLGLNILTALIYWAFSGIGFQLAEIHGNVSPIWPSSGLAVAAMFFGGYRLLPGVLMGAFAANACNDITLLSALIIALGACGEAAVAGWLLCRIRTWASNLVPHTTPIWILITSLIAPIVAAIIGSSSISYLNSFETPPQFGQVALTWFAGNSIGILIIVPVLLTVKMPSFTMKWCLKLLSLFALSALVYALISFQQPGSALYFLAFILLIPACQWFGPAGCALSTLSFAVFSAVMIFTNQDTPQFVSYNNKLLALDTFLFALSITSLTLASLYKKGHFKIPAILLILGWLASGLIYDVLQNISTKIDEINFSNLVHDTEAAISDRLNSYIDALISGASIYTNSDELRSDEWRSFVEQLNLSERYPGINGIGIIQPLNEDEIKDFVAQQRASGETDFKIKQISNLGDPTVDAVGDEHYIVTYLEPHSLHSKVLGMDLATESNRLIACHRARDSGRTSISDSILLAQDGKARPSFLVFYPMYQRGAPTTTTAERRDALVGWINASFITEVFLDGILGNRGKQIQFNIYDSPNIKPERLIYSNSESPLSEEPSKFAHTSTLKLADKTFSFGWNRGPSFPQQETASATIAAASIALGSCLLVVIVVNLQSTNRRTKQIVEERTLALSAANEKLQKEVRDRQKAEAEANQAYLVADAANSAKSEFLATMSHEMRTPMNSVLGFAELIGNSPLNADQRIWATYIQSSGNSLLELINDILDFSKIEAGKFELEAIPFSIRQAIDEVIRSFNPVAAEKGLLINIEVSDRLPTQLVGDPTRLKQVITNLVSNSLKFTKTGSVDVAATWTGNKGNGVAKISVTDSGIGIPNDKIGHLFERFSQVDSSTTRQYGGTGLGLAICKRIVNLMRGEIQVDRSDESGTTISFRIPFTVSQQIEQKAKSPHLTTNPANEHITNKRRVLVVDDNAVNRKLAQTVLSRLGNEVDTANNGVEAVEQVTQHFYDIVFLDCQMPIMDGYVATQKIRQLEAEGKIPGSTPDTPLPIIALTANASEKDRQACLDSGMDDYICKPAKIEDYRTAFKRLEESQRSEQYRA